MSDDTPVKTVIVYSLEDTRRRSAQHVRWLDQIEGDLPTMRRLRSWRTTDGGQGKEVLSGMVDVFLMFGCVPISIMRLIIQTQRSFRIEYDRPPFKAICMLHGNGWNNYRKDSDFACSSRRIDQKLDESFHFHIENYKRKNYTHKNYSIIISSQVAMIFIAFLFRQ